jgi:uncharacterized protein YbaR (Trm112 family)
VKKQKCPCGSDKFKELMKMETFQEHVSVFSDGTVSYDDAGSIETIDGSEDWESRELVCEACEKVFRLVNGVLLPTKKLVLKVRTLGDYDGLSADYAVVELGPASIDRIKKLSQTVRDLKTYRISEFNYDSQFFVEEWDTDPDNGLVAMEKFEGQMDCNTLKVTDHDFYWSGNYRNTNIRWETSAVPISALDEHGDLDEREKFPEIQEVAT